MENLQIKPTLIWFTGLSGAGKTTLSQLLNTHLRAHGVSTIVLDGDELRSGLCSDLGFTPEARSENIRRAGEIAKLLLRQGTVTLAAFMSPLHQDRASIREMVGAEHFFEIYCKCAFETCAERDVKGLYRKAKQGEIKNMIGRDNPYEEPVHPDVIVETDLLSIEESINKILESLAQKGVYCPSYSNNPDHN